MLTGLTWLNLSENELSGKGIRGIMLPSNLVFLNLGNNRIKTIPDFGFVQLTQLKCLILNNNQLKDISFVSDLVELNTLILAHNQISSIPPDVFSKLTYLRKLNISHNQLSQFPNVSHLQHLTELNLNNNNISSLPTQLKECTRLKILDISNNVIPHIDCLHVLSSIKTLTHLNAIGNTLYPSVINSEDKSPLSQVESRICSMLPSLCVLNSRILSHGKEVKNERKRHYEELLRGSEKKRGFEKDHSMAMTSSSKRRDSGHSHDSPHINEATLHHDHGRSIQHQSLDVPDNHVSNELQPNIPGPRKKKDITHLGTTREARPKVLKLNSSLSGKWKSTVRRMNDSSSSSTTATATTTSPASTATSTSSSHRSEKRTANGKKTMQTSEVPNKPVSSATSRVDRAIVHKAVKSEEKKVTKEDLALSGIVSSSSSSESMHRNKVEPAPKNSVLDLIGQLNESSVSGWD